MARTLKNKMRKAKAYREEKKLERNLKLTPIESELEATTKENAVYCGEIQFANDENKISYLRYFETKKEAFTTTFQNACQIYKNTPEFLNDNATLAITSEQAEEYFENIDKDGFWMINFENWFQVCFYDINNKTNDVKLPGLVDNLRDVYNELGYEKLAAVSIDNQEIDNPFFADIEKSMKKNPGKLMTA